MTQQVIFPNDLPSKNTGHQLKAVEFNYLNDVVNHNSIDMESRLVNMDEIHSRVTKLESLPNTLGVYESYNLPDDVENGYLAYDKLLSTLAYHKDGNWYRVSNNEFIYVDQIVFKIDTTKPGTSSDTFSLLVGEPLRFSEVCDFEINWGDGTSDIITDYTDPALTHVYETSGVKTITIKGVFNGFDWFDTNETTTDKEKLLDIISWGNYTTTGSAYGSFYKCSNLDVSAINEPDMSNVTNLFWFFAECPQLTKIPYFDTSQCSEWFGTFVNCSSLVNIPEYNFDGITSNFGFRVTFQNCSNLLKLPDSLASDGLSGTSGAKNFRNAFTGCQKITTIPEINFSQADDCRSLFFLCYNLTDITYIPDFSSVTLLTSAWHQCNLTADSIKNILKGLDNSGKTGLSTSIGGGVNPLGKFNAYYDDWDQETKDLYTELTTTKSWTILANGI